MTDWRPVPFRDGFEFSVVPSPFDATARVTVRVVALVPRLFSVGYIPAKFDWRDLADEVEKCTKVCERFTSTDVQGDGDPAKQL